MGWFGGAVLVLLVLNAYALWSSNRTIAVVNLVIDGLILFFAVITGYRRASKEQH